MRASFVPGVLALALASTLACTELRSSPPDGLGGEGGNAAAGSGGRGGIGGRGGSAGVGTAGSGVAGSGGGVAGSGVAGTGGTIACDDTLIGWWPLNEGSGTSTSDESASAACARNDQTGTLLGGATWTTGHQGAGVALNGSTGVVAVQPADGSPLWNYPTAPMTMMAWIRPDAAAIASTAATAVARTHEDYAFQNFWLGLVSGNPRCTIHNEYGDGPTALAKVPANAWTHVACTYGLDGAILVYVNGNLAATGNTNQVLGPIPTRILLGASELENSSVLAYFSGVIDDARIWNRALTAAQVRAIAQQ